MAELDRALRHDGRKLGTMTLALAAVLALFAGGLAYVKDFDLSSLSGDEPAYCWGAWKGEQLPWSESEDVDVKDDAPPTADRPSGECAFRYGRDREAEEDEGPPQYTHLVSVTYDRPPSQQGDRLPWLTRYFDGQAAPLPDGLPGLVSPERGMVVLPSECDESAEPTVVTLTAKTRQSSADEASRSSLPSHRHSRSKLSALLLSAAQKGMEHAGCADERDADERDADERETRARGYLDEHYDDRRYEGDHDDGGEGEAPDPDESGFRTDGVVLGAPANDESGTRKALCHLAGMLDADSVLGSAGNRHAWSPGLGVPGAPDHVCSYRAELDEPDVATDSDGLDREWTNGLSLIATADPRLERLLVAATQRDDNEDLPGWEATTTASKDLAVVRVACGDESQVSNDTVFAVVRSHPTKLSPAKVLPRYVRAVEGHLGCAGVAPRD